MTISSLSKKLSIVAVATLVTAAAGNANAIYADNGLAGLAPAKDVAAARNGAGLSTETAARGPVASGTNLWSAAGIDPSRSLGAALARK